MKTAPVNLRILIVFAFSLFMLPGSTLTAAEVPVAKHHRTRGVRTGKKVSSRGSSRSKKGNSRKGSKRKGSAVTVLYKGEDGSWIHKGRRGIVISRDSAGTVRAMTPFTTDPHAGKEYAEAINRYARVLGPDGVRVYSLIAPTQGEYYLPEQVSTRGAERHAIEITAGYLDPSVTPVFVDSIFKRHLDEEIYNRTDHHWSPLGAFYASEVLARKAGVRFRPSEEYATDTLRNYVGTMYRFSGDPAVKSHPEEFVWFLPPEGYKAEFINYTLSGGKTIGESAGHEEPFFRRFDDGSGAAYCTFMGGDSRTVAVSGTGGTPGRRLLIVKDSFGNAMAGCLFGSFEEVHVVDFRYFPHNLVEYAREHGITDLCFVNCTSLAFAPNTAARLRTMSGVPAGEGNGVDEEEDEVDEEDEDMEGEEESDGE